MGGPTDEEPPKLISSVPADQSTGMRPEKILLTFDEFVGLDNPGKGIVITPKINKDLVEFTALKNTIGLSQLPTTAPVPSWLTILLIFGSIVPTKNTCELKKADWPATDFNPSSSCYAQATLSSACSMTVF